MIPCISQATILNSGFETDPSVIARAGWRTVELWLTKVETYLRDHSVAQARELLRSNGIKASAAAFQGGLLLSRGEERATHWEHFRGRLELLQELDVPILIVAADPGWQASGEDYDRAAASLAEAAALAATFGVRLALEFQKSSVVCACLETAVALIQHAGASNLGVCFDVFHYYTGPSKFEDLAYLDAQSLAWVQISDMSGTARELATDGDRVLPGDGDFQLASILEHFERMGYEGPVSLEVLNPALWQVPADRVADLGYQAVARVLPGRTATSPKFRGGS